MLIKISKRFSSRLLWILIISVFCLIGIGLILYSTVWGAALSDDSYYYISSARNLLADRGFDLAPNFPPMLPLVLSVIGLLKVDPLTAIRWLNAVLFALNIYLVSRIVYRLTKSSPFSILGALFMLISSTLIMIHAWAMSEALYVTFTLLGFLSYIVGNEKGTWQAPIFTGLFFGLAAATRYIGISLLLAGGILFLTEVGKSNRLRIRNCLIFSSVGVIPLLFWVVRNELIVGQPTNRVFGWYWMAKSLWINILNTILLWLVPGRFVNGKELIWLGGIILVIVIWIGIRLLQKRSKSVLSDQPDSQKNPIMLIILSMISYWIILILSRSFFDPLIPMDERLLSPILVMGLILLAWIYSELWNRKKWVEFGIISALSLMFLITNLTRSAQMIQNYHEVGRGYASARDHVSETYAYLRNRPDIPIYSNAFAAIYFWTGRVTNPIPSADNIPAMKADMQEDGAYLVIFDSIPLELYGTTTEEITKDLVEQIRLSEATIYRSP
jgi:hypothetical protein